LHGLNINKKINIILEKNIMPFQLQQLCFTIIDNQYETAAKILDDAQALAVSLTDAEDYPVYEPEPDSVAVWKKIDIHALFPLETDLTAVITDLDIDTYTIEKIEDKAWERVCMDLFHPVKFGEKLWICPSWEKVSEPGACVVMLDPGLAFGTGSHATTQLCLEWLAAQDIKNKIVIDYGCGSGILGIAAAKMGAACVYAVDIDPQALDAVQENAARNHIPIHAFLPEHCPDIQADILIANILATPLIHLAPRLISYLNIQGKLVLSGILDEQKESVQDAYDPYIQFQPPVVKETWVRLEGLRVH
jgi:ribosomal protein L11 methyltransferase